MKSCSPSDDSRYVDSIKSLQKIARERPLSDFVRLFDEPDDCIDDSQFICKNAENDALMHDKTLCLTNKALNLETLKSHLILIYCRFQRESEIIKLER